MDDPLAFTPAPSRKRHAGWTAERQRRFLDGIRRGLTHAQVAAAVKLSRQSAYRLCQRPGGAGFAAAWHAAEDGARRVRTLKASGLATLTQLDGLLVPRFHRGQLAGFSVREDDRAVLARLQAARRRDLL